LLHPVLIDVIVLIAAPSALPPWPFLIYYFLLLINAIQLSLKKRQIKYPLPSAILFYVAITVFHKNFTTPSFSRMVL